MNFRGSTIQSSRISSLALTSVAAILLSGCATSQSAIVTAKPLPSPVVSRTEERLDPGLFSSPPEGKEGEPYRIGAGDTILIAVYNHPELAIAAYSGTGLGGLPGGRGAGFLVDNDGTAQLPLLGSVKVAGKTSNDLRVYLEDQLSRFINQPRVTTQVLFNGSIRYYLLGQFVTPGLKLSDRPLHLMEALSLGGSIVIEHASLSGAYVARKGHRLPINFRRLLRDGDLTQNIPLQNGDTIFVPDNLTEQAFVFGGSAGSNSRGGAVPFVAGRLDILQALAQAGMGFRERTQGRLSEVRVIRSEGDSGQFFVVDVNRILRGEAANFPLAPGDIVFIPETALTTWTEAMQQILPSLQVISGLLTPFVQIKFLSQ
jgi:polysaccharide export outer membrane protein